MKSWILEKAKRIRALAQAGLHYSESNYDLERFEELEMISTEMIAELASLDVDQIETFLPRAAGYPNPKVDVRAVVFQEKRILMVQEKTDQLWALPGGWADIGHSAGEVATKEVAEEAGMEVKSRRLLALLDNRFHGHPPALDHVYKIFVGCEIVSGTPRAGADTLDARFFSEESLPPLSQGRNTEEEVREMFRYLEQPDRMTWYD